MLWFQDHPFHLAPLRVDDCPLYFRAAGVSFRQKYIVKFRDRFPNTPAFLSWLWPEPENPNHERAVRLMLFEPYSHEACHAGYVPRELADEWFPLVCEMELKTGFWPAFATKFLGGVPAAPTLGLLVAGVHPRLWPQDRSDLGFHG